uniref:Uncharacterized protein n=1 Tax=Solanum lycopersicum TaxID=4081 RepID=A0A3Q7JGC3_SOLLC
MELGTMQRCRTSYEIAQFSILRPFGIGKYDTQDQLNMCGSNLEGLWQSELTTGGIKKSNNSIDKLQSNYKLNCIIEEIQQRTKQANVKATHHEANEVADHLVKLAMSSRKRLLSTSPARAKGPFYLYN